MSVNEISELLSWIGNPPRNPMQTHGLNESDSEVVDLGNGTWLAATVDSVSEEIAAGLYRDPYTIGWVTAMASLSDLSAVGAQPVGMLLAVEWSRQFDTAQKSEVARGFSDALRRCGTFWLGGDSGRAAAAVLSGVALGTCDSKPMSRKGWKAGDLVCVTGKTGTGPGLAIRYILGEKAETFPETLFRPVARVAAGVQLRGLASAAMDTSDGLLTTLHTLSLLNGSGLELEWVPEILSEPGVSLVERVKLPLWTLLGVEHGDYELVLGIPPENLDKARLLVPDLTVIGKVGKGQDTTIRLPDGKTRPIDLAFARSLLTEARTDLKTALAELARHAKELGLP